MTLDDYFANVWRAIQFFGWSASCMVNSMRGGEPFESLSAAIGKSILQDGFWSRVPMLKWLRLHFEKARQDFKEGKHLLWL